MPNPAELRDDLREAMEANEKKAGFLPNVARAYAHKPDQFRAFFQYDDAQMRGASRSASSKKTRSVAGRSETCVRLTRLAG